jgi:hypothetical protein
MPHAARCRFNDAAIYLFCHGSVYHRFSGRHLGRLAFHEGGDPSLSPPFRLTLSYTMRGVQITNIIKRTVDGIIAQW